VLASDLNGNLLSDGTSGYTWDARNRLTGITGPVSATFQYDTTGRRTRKTINGLMTDFVHDGINPVTESGPSGTGFLLTGLGVDDFLLRLGPASTSMFLTDALGSLVATTDAAGGVQSEVTYEPFGNTEISAPAPAYRFTGREDDEPLYLYYYRARYYHTDLQRFISEDPVGFISGDTNLYAYVTNNPLSFVDSFGLEKERKECWDEDYSAVDFSFAIRNPITGNLVGPAVRLAVDRYGNWYGSLGASVGRTAIIPVAVSKVSGLVNGTNAQGEELVPSEERLIKYMTGPSLSAGLGAGLGFGRVWSTGGTGREFGYYTPQAGFTGAGTIHLFKSRWRSPIPRCG